MNLIEQILAQSRIGSAEGAVLPGGDEAAAQTSAYLRELPQNRQNQQRLNLMERHQDQQDMLLPLQMQKLQQDNALTGLKTMAELRDQQQFLANEAGVAELSGIMREITSGGKLTTPEGTRESLGRVFKHMSDNPSLNSDPRAMNLIKMFNDGMQWGLDFQKLQGFSPNIRTLKEPGTGREISVIQTGPNSFSEVAGTGLTTATETRLQEADLAADRVFTTANKLLPKLTPETTGIRGAVNRVIVDSSIAQFFPNMRIGESVDAMALARHLTGAVVRMLRTDSNITEKERNDLEAAIPRPDNFLESAQAAKSKLAVTVEQMAEASRSGALKRGIPIPTHYLKPEEISQMYKDKKITEAQVVEMLQNNAWIFVDRIRAEVKR